MSHVISVAGHGAATLVAADAARVVLECPFASPPGSSLSFLVEGGREMYKLKVSICKRLPGDGVAVFRIEGRLVDLTRAQRAALEALRQGRSS